MKRTALIVALAATACTTEVPFHIDGDAGAGDGGVSTPAELQGAGGRDLTEFWPRIDIPFSDNTKMLNYPMLVNEVARATTLSWTDASGNDMWERNKSVLGAADYVNTWESDRQPSQQKMVTIRKMAFAVCGDLVDAEAGQAQRTVFAATDPAAAISSADSAVSEQVTQMFRRFFLEAPSQTEIDESIQSLVDLQNMADSREAWRGLCAAYLSSMRFLSY